MSSVWQVHPGTQPGQKVVMKGKGIMKGMQVDIIWRNLFLLKNIFWENTFGIVLSIASNINVVPSDPKAVACSGHHSTQCDHYRTRPYNEIRKFQKKKNLKFNCRGF
jgi:hypothetical protein